MVLHRMISPVVSLQLLLLSIVFQFGASNDDYTDCSLNAITDADLDGNGWVNRSEFQGMLVQLAPNCDTDGAFVVEQATGGNTLIQNVWSIATCTCPVAVDNPAYNSTVPLDGCCTDQLRVPSSLNGVYGKLCEVLDVSLNVECPSRPRQQPQPELEPPQQPEPPAHRAGGDDKKSKNEDLPFSVPTFAALTQQPTNATLPEPEETVQEEPIEEEPVVAEGEEEEEPIVEEKVEEPIVEEEEEPVVEEEPEPEPVVEEEPLAEEEPEPEPETVRVEEPTAVVVQQEEDGESRNSNLMLITILAAVGSVVLFMVILIAYIVVNSRGTKYAPTSAQPSEHLQIDANSSTGQTYSHPSIEKQSSLPAVIDQTDVMETNHEDMTNFVDDDQRPTDVI